MCLFLADGNRPYFTAQRVRAWYRLLFVSSTGEERGAETVQSELLDILQQTRETLILAGLSVYVGHGNITTLQDAIRRQRDLSREARARGQVLLHVVYFNACSVACEITSLYLAQHHLTY